MKSKDEFDLNSYCDIRNCKKVAYGHISFEKKYYYLKRPFKSFDFCNEHWFEYLKTKNPFYHS